MGGGDGRDSSNVCMISAVYDTGIRGGQGQRRSVVPTTLPSSLQRHPSDVAS